MKKIKLKFEHIPMSVGDPTYLLVQMVNAAQVTPALGPILQIGSRVTSEEIDSIARDRRWECVIVSVAR